MRFESFVAKRYLMSQSKGVFSLITTIIGILGVCVGVAALITTLAVMSGFQNDIKKKVIGAQAHILVLGQMPQGRYQQVQRDIETLPLVSAVSPNTLGQAILNYQGRSMGVVIRGLDPQEEKNTSDLISSLTEGSFSSKEGDAPAIVLGTELAFNIGVEVGDEVVLVSPRSIAGGLPKMKKFKISGLLRTGYYEYDNTVVYTDINSAADFLGIDGVTGLSVKLKNLDDAPRAADQIRELTRGSYAVKTFSELNSTLYAALKLEKAMMFIILSLIILVASLNITSNLILFGTEKLRDIGIMRAVGASPRQIKRIFMLEGFFIGTLGILAGVVLALILCWAIGTFDFVRLPADIYYLTKVPVSLQWQDVLSVVAGSYFLCFLSALYPAYKAAKVNPVDAIRYG